MEKKREREADLVVDVLLALVELVLWEVDEVNTSSEVDDKVDDDVLWKADAEVMDVELSREVDEVVLEVEANKEVLVEVLAVDRFWVIDDVEEVREVDDATDTVEVDAWKNNPLCMEVSYSTLRHLLRLTWMFVEALVKSGAHVRHPAAIKLAKGAALSQHQPNKPSPVPLTHVPNTHPTHSIIRYEKRRGGGKNHQ